MSLNSIFQYFVPKDRKFFPLFEQATANLVDISTCLVKVVSTTDEDKKIAFYKEIERLEHVGDDVTHQILLELSKNFITPFDREDIHALATAIDDVADYIYGSANRLNLYKITQATDSMVELAVLIQQACSDLHKAVCELKDLKNFRNITDSCVRINSAENQADHVFNKAVADLFDHEENALVIMKYKEILSVLETATDKCEDAANVMESILVKHA